MKGIKIPVTGPMEVVEIQDNWRALAKIVGTEDLIERVRVDETHAMVVDEIGLIKALPTNHRAGVLYGTHRHGSRIAGDAVYLSEGPDGEGGIDFIGLTDPAYDLQYLASQFIAYGVDPETGEIA